jgi:hypothetical protein
MNRPILLFRRTAGAIILRITYGYEIEEENDPFVSTVDKALEYFSLSSTPGCFLVDLVPSCTFLQRCIPSVIHSW